MAEIEFADDEETAKERAETHRSTDPFPSAPCALLSSAEVHDYARVTAMLFPFYASSLKSASYEAHIGGEFIRWDENGTKIEEIVGRGDSCVLPPNSISFVQVEPTFRLPHYIALRFNLRITHVHRGLLLGTGPLVDPGFEGKLLVPLHNLTSSEYRLNTNDALIWIEFTKTTYGTTLKEKEASKDRMFAEFPVGKKDKSAKYYFYKASQGAPIQSSIPTSVKQAAESARKSEKAAATSRNVIVGAAIIAIAGIGATVGQLMIQQSDIAMGAIGLTTNVKKSFSRLEAENKDAAKKIDKLEQESSRHRTHIGTLMNKISELERKLDKRSRK